MRIVVKVGTSTLAYPTGRLNIRHAEELVKVLSDLKNEGHEVILVSSGAIGMGVGKLSLPARPKDTTTKQACAAVGQCELMYTYDRLFSAYDHTVAQILLTGVDVEHTERRVNIQNTLSRLLELGALPIINENDSVATDEITYMPSKPRSRLSRSASHLDSGGSLSLARYFLSREAGPLLASKLPRAAMKAELATTVSRDPKSIPAPGLLHVRLPRPQPD